MVSFGRIELTCRYELSLDAFPMFFPGKLARPFRGFFLHFFWGGDHRAVLIALVTELNICLSGITVVPEQQNQRFTRHTIRIKTNLPRFNMPNPTRFHLVVGRVFRTPQV